MQSYTYKVERSNVFDETIVKAVIELDALVYPEDLRGDTLGERARFKKDPTSFLLLKANERIVGYFCFFPITKMLQDTVFTTSKLVDNDIGPDDITPYKRGEKHMLFIISIVVHPKHRGAPSKMLLDAFFQSVKHMHQTHYPIEAMVAYAVSGKGSSTLERFGFGKYKTVEQGYTLYHATIDAFLKAGEQHG